MAPTLTEQLIQSLNRQQIAYCHWKSNFALVQQTPEAAAENDLDLLVERRMFPCMEQILQNHGFKAARAKAGSNPPSIYHYYGHDQASGSLVHVHLFTKVITGESLVKSHSLPFERMLLENVCQIGEMKVASRAAELVLFFVRTCIKYGSLMDLRTLLRDPQSVQEELAWLQSGSDPAEAVALLRRYCPVIEEVQFTEGLKTLAKPGAILAKLRLARQVRRRLAGYRKYKRGQHALAYTAAIGDYVGRRLTRQRRNKTLTSGGAVIAFVGPEATGKSTLVATSHEWLGNAFAVQAIHAGKPPSTWLTTPINRVLPFLRRLTPGLRTNRIAGNLPASNEEQHVTRSSKASPSKPSLTTLVYAIRAVAVAWDRRALLIAARRAAAQGTLIICDRYPSEMVGAMDSPRLQVDSSQQGLMARIYARLATIEAALYRQIPPPDVVIKLSVSLETAKQRNRDRIKLNKESDAYLEARHRQVQNWCRPGTQSIHAVSTEKSQAETIAEIKELIWQEL